MNEKIINGKETHLIIARLYHEQCGFVLFDPHVERGQRAPVFFCGVQQDRLVHRYPNRQPGP